VKRTGRAGAKRIPGPSLDLGPKGLEPHALDGVLEPGLTALEAIAEVALGGDHGLGDRQCPVRLHEAEDVGQSREGRGVPVGRAHPAAGRDVEADQAFAVGDGDEAQVVGIDVDIVVRRHRNGGLELPRQIGRAVDGLEILAAAHLLAVEPDLVIGAGLRQQVLADPLRPLVNLPMQRRRDRVGVAEHVAVHIAAAADRVDHDLVDPADHRGDVALEDAVVLEALTRGQAQTAAGQLAADPVDRQPLGRGADTARQARAQHEAEIGLEILLAPLLTEVAMVLLIEAVKLADLGVVRAHGAGQRVGQTLAERAAQIVAAGLDPDDQEDPPLLGQLARTEIAHGDDPGVHPLTDRLRSELLGHCFCIAGLGAVEDGDRLDRLRLGGRGRTAAADACKVAADPGDLRGRHPLQRHLQGA
jgi:hypothetical protein